MDANKSVDLTGFALFALIRVHLRTDLLLVVERKIRMARHRANWQPSRFR
ncbi:MAG: hypothetical protein OJF61_002735 [Rhodanobacteraceae bacterium]|jgi:hypothetical protein|nr:MAG: hypothetical protein OJF61_002735 [Rhodanobacteraceae bacterium]